MTVPAEVIAHEGIPSSFTEAAPETERSKLRHKHNLHELASEDISVNEPVTLDFFMRDYVDHLKKHLSQIFG